MNEAVTDQPGTIRIENEGGVYRVTISNPRRYNAMSYSMWRAVGDAVEAANSDDTVRVVVLRGEGEKSFVSGADISEFGTKRNDPEQVALYAQAVDRAQSALKACKRPTIAVVRGICMGGGMGLALSCDLRYAAADSKFRMPAGRLGVGYAREGVKRFANMIGFARTADLFLTARIFDGTEAARIGMVHEVFATETFDEVIEERIAEIASNAPLTLVAVKKTLRHLMTETGAPSADEVDAAVQACFDSQDYRDGQKAFAEKRKPEFKGV